MPPAVSASVTDKLSVAQLEQVALVAADILRGAIDSSDYKTYIFGLLFPETAVRSAGQGTTDSGSEGVTFLCTSCRDFDDLLDHPRCGLPLHHQPALVHAVFGDYVPKLFEVQ